MTGDARESWRRAASFAARAHRDGVRLDGVTPYFAHPARVAITVATVFGCDCPDAITIALLHDVIEDTTADYEDVLEEFGAEVADAVSALSKHPALPEPEREADYDDRLSRADWRARLVKLADVLDNMSDTGPGTPPEKLARLADRAERAVALAKADAEPLMPRAVEIVEEALGSFRAGL